MLEVTPFRPVVVACLADPAALDTIRFAEGIAGRVAPDELLWFALGVARGDAVEHATAHVTGADPGALVVDQSDGWAGFTLAGDHYPEAHARLSAVRLPDASPAFVQGAVAGLAAKVLVLADRLHVAVATTVVHHLHHRIVEAAADLGVHERPGAEAATPAGVGAGGATA